MARPKPIIGRISMSVGEDGLPFELATFEMPITATLTPGTDGTAVAHIGIDPGFREVADVIAAT